MTKATRRRLAAAKKIGHRVRTARVSLGWSQQKLAEESGISRPQITRIENGDQQPRYERIEALAKALDVSVAFLLSIDE